MKKTATDIGFEGGAAVLMDTETGEIIANFGAYLGRQTNNFAEYTAIILALQKALELGATEVDCIMDSELAVKQLRREYKVKEPTLQKLWLEVYNLSTKFKKITYRHTLRAGNKEADAEVNKALDAELIKSS
jgi:ribonuclease HI